MTTESDNAQIFDGENTLSMVSALRSTDTQTTTTEPAQAEPTAEPKTEGQPATETTPTATETQTPENQPELDAEAKRNALLREIAMDPALTQQYAQQQYYPQTQQPQYAQQPLQQLQTPQQPALPELPFDEFTFDANNPEHQAALFSHQLQQVGGPLFEQMQQITQKFQQEEALKQQQLAKQATDNANQKTVQMLDTYVPGFGDIASKVMKGESWSVQEEAVFNLAVNLESQFLQAYPHAANNVQARAQIAQVIGPILQEKAKALGLVAQPKTAASTLTPEQKKVMKQEGYVESSNAVPVSTGAFEDAFKKGDSLSMIRALRTTSKT